jgi:hypothetical protein
MCFSATASFAAGAVLAGIGAIAARNVRAAREIPYAMIPAFFSAQQIVEGGLWLTIAEGGNHLNAALTHIYQFFSHVLWPMYVPFAVRLLEPVPWRRAALLVFAGLGAAVGLYLFYFLLMEPTTARVTAGHVDYISPHFYIGPVLAGYILATCASSLLSSHRAVQWFGVAVAASLASAALLYRTWFISVWCFFAAAISVVVLAYFHRPNSESLSDKAQARFQTIA